jgi:metal-responsive CopG/Arc/MetJ family transcriptional regulator
MSFDKSVSKRINVTLPDSVVDELEDWANAQGRSLANLAAFLLEMAIKEAKDKGEIPSQGFSSQQKKKRQD